MSATEVIVRILAIIAVIIGFALILNLVGIHLFGVGIANPILEAIVGILFIGGGLVVLRGGNITI